MMTRRRFLEAAVIGIPVVCNGCSKSNTEDNHMASSPPTTETTHHIEVADGPCPDGARNTIGGTPILQEGRSIPACQKCGRDLTLFLQFDVDPAFNLPFKAGSHVLLFSCVGCDDGPDEGYSGSDKTVQETYGNPVCGNYALYLNPPGGNETIHTHDNELQARQITFVEAQEAIRVREYVGKDSEDSACKVGGTPSWINYSVNLNCQCGAPIVFLCQIPDYYEFPTGPKATDGKNSLNLFLGNFIYVLGCAKQCTPHSLLVVCDN